MKVPNVLYKFVGLMLAVSLGGCGGGGSDSSTTVSISQYTVSGTTNEPGTTLMLTGEVTNNAVAIATRPLEKFVRETTSRTGGAYELVEIPDGSYTITPRKDGYTFSPLSIIFKVGGGDYPRLDFTAIPVS